MKKLIIAMLLFLPFAAMAQENTADFFKAEIRQLEKDAGGRIGVAAINTDNGQMISYREQERFAFCSTYKLPLVAAVLAKVDTGTETLQRSVSYSQADMVTHAPITGKHLTEGKMTVAELSEAAIEYSDNTAANLLYAMVGGPKGLTRFARAHGDKTSHFDRNETALNSNLPGDKRDTTTPAAMLALMKLLLTGDALSPSSREQLVNWLIANTTGDMRLRAGIDKGWKVGDKTGTGDNGANNDVAIVWPPGSKPYLIVAFYTGSDRPQRLKDAVIAQIAATISNAFKRGKN